MNNTLNDIMKRLKEFAPKKCKGFVEITLPIVLNINGTVLNLRIESTDLGYKICYPYDLFYDANRSQKWYYNLFLKNDKNYHCDLQVNDSVIYKNYDNEYNIAVAVSDFVHFFVLLDNFIINNQIIGNEENFDY